LYTWNLVLFGWLSEPNPFVLRSISTYGNISSIIKTIVEGKVSV
jgi:hypothetical protein